ncbi:clathrin heavy chain linker domain-containing protein 1 isoform X1 [Ictalurus furcatus]|uniref:clathrin heavy chain linker domain-containing protein 1 isoform X1 n=1 Tax=Ictalurus furcatus TaxID=66913 RepID=UPI00234FE669|nr:clathrin heavy chain linker domain-containing protein 1 isoform X1 [Ictalurus furcatus]XP_053474949.1 clathrin heavy chain linker domain-containing protein 1 isoform X1 [Ictalurus furcatus]
MEFNGRTAPLFESASDRSFMQSLKEFIKSEKEQLGCPDEGPDEQRYTIYSTAFDKIIDYATAYKPILTAIKKEYDDFIASVKSDQRQAQLAQGKLKAMLARPTSLMYYQRRAAQLQERISAIQRNTADLQAEIKRLQECKTEQEDSQQRETLEVTVPTGQLPGLSLSESLNPESLNKHLEQLAQKRNELLNKKKNQYVPVQVKTDLDVKMKVVLNQRDELSVENDKLLLRYKRLTRLKEALSRWAKSGSRSPLLELLSSELKHVSEMKGAASTVLPARTRPQKTLCSVFVLLSSCSFILVCEDDRKGFRADRSEEDDPGEVKESRRLAAYVERFVKLFDAGEYEDAAFHAARSPHGVLRNMSVMEKFKAITAYEGALPPVLLFFRLLMISAPPGKPLPETLSSEGVRCALKHGYVELVTFGVSQHRLTYSEELGDLICSHGDDDLRVVDTCLALAQIVYSACGVLRKAALTMCKRGLTGAALEYIYYNKEFTIDDCMFVLRGLPSVALLRDFTQPCDRVPALMSVGFICHYLLNSDLEDLAFHLLEQIHAGGRGALEKTVLEDDLCSVESWSEIATRCEQTNRLDLAQDITSTLLRQDGAMRLSPGLDSAKLMEHVFM